MLFFFVDFLKIILSLYQKLAIFDKTFSMATQYTRRSLFKILIARNLNSADPLFEKYRRKNYSVRHYS